MKRVKYAIIYNYLRTGELLKNGTATVYIRAYLPGKQPKYFNTGVYVLPKQWDDANKRVINHPHAGQLNETIQTKLRKMEAYEMELHRRGEAIALKRLEDYKKHEEVVSFTDFVKKHVLKAGVAPSTRSDYNQTLDKLLDFRSEIYFDEISFSLVDEFDGFLRHELDLSPNTVAKHHKNLRAFVNQAIRSDLLDSNRNPYIKFKIRIEPTERIFLTEAELALWEQVEFPPEKEHLYVIKDFFLFCCYTGLRYSDVSRVSKAHLVDGPDGIELSIRTQKSKKPWHYNLRKFFPTKGEQMSRPEAIIRRRLDFHHEFWGMHSSFDNKPLFDFTNQYVNRELKTVAAMLAVRGIVKEKLSIHSGRHTFGTIMAGKVDVQILQQLMQHSKLKETMVYVHLNKRAINNILDGIDW